MRLIYVVDGRLLGVVVLSGLQAARVASAGNRDGFAIMSVVLLKFRSELNTTIKQENKSNYASFKF